MCATPMCASPMCASPMCASGLSAYKLANLPGAVTSLDPVACAPCAPGGFSLMDASGGGVAGGFAMPTEPVSHPSSSPSPNPSPSPSPSPNPKPNPSPSPSPKPSPHPHSSLRPHPHPSPHPHKVCRGQHPKWHPPPANQGQRVTGLRVHNSLTSEKELFVPKEGNKVSMRALPPPYPHPYPYPYP
mgnify:CR=1 FL=1